MASLDRTKLQFSYKMHASLMMVLFSAGFLNCAARAQTFEAAGAGGAGKKVEEQGESDWVDGRWNQTDIGPFLASSLPTPAGLVAKALSIRVGENGEAAVCYDTGSPSMRATWTGRFLTFDSGRYGLVRPPTAAGDWNYVAPPGLGWKGAAARHESVRLNGRRLVLTTRVGDTLVRETPWVESSGDARAFTRTIEAAPGQTALTLRLFQDAKSQVESENRDGLQLASAKQGSSVIRFALPDSDPIVKLQPAEGAIDLLFLPSTRPRRAKLFFWSGKGEDPAGFEKLASKSPAAEDMDALAHPAPPRWLPALTTKGQTDFPNDGLAVDTLTVPYRNPWNALFFCAGVDFFKDGSAAVCTIHGDVWKVGGIDAKLGQLKWQRYATGLFQPLGLRVVEDKVYVLGRDQITRLQDENGDGEADGYENFYNRIKTLPGHDYVTCLERDSAGNFYFIDPQGVHRVSPDGRSDELLASGFRNPNGLGASPGGIVTATPQPGKWTPSSAIVEVRQGGYYGYGGPRPLPERPLGYDPVLCWLPHAFDNSSSSQVWVPEGKWGSLAGQMLHFAWGRCGMALVLRDASGTPVQGGAVSLPVRFLSGPMRGTFNPADDALYVACSRGWQTSAAQDGALQRVRHTGAPSRMPVGWQAPRNGIALVFAQPVDPATAGDAGSFAVRQWNYRYAKEYGSKDYSVAHPDQEGRDEVEVRRATVLADGRTVFLETPELKPVMQMEVKYNLNFASGKTASGPFYLTLNRLSEPF